MEKALAIPTIVMATFTIAAVIAREEYDQFFRLLEDDPRFPMTYEAWLKRTTRDLKRRKAHGEVRELTIHHEEFAFWCESRGKKPSFAMLEAFAVAKAQGKQRGRDPPGGA